MRPGGPQGCLPRSPWGVLTFQGPLTGREQLTELWARAGAGPLLSIDLSGTGCTDDVLAALADDVRTRLVTTLVLDGAPITAAGLRALQHPDRMPALAELSLRGTLIGDDGALELATLDRPLRRLHLDDAGVRTLGLEFLLAAPWIPVLEVLTLPMHDGPPGSAGHHLADAGLHRLRHLDLAGWWFTESVVHAVSRSAALSGVTHLDLSRTTLDDRGAAAIATSPVFSRLHTLLLAGNRVRQAGALSLARAPHLGALRTLDMTANAIGVSGVLALVRSTALADLATLRCDWGCVAVDDWHLVEDRFPLLPVPERVRAHRRDDPAVLDAALAEARNSGRLSLHAVRIGPQTQRLLRDDRRLTDVRQLVLHRNQLGDDGARALAGSTAVTALTHLELVDNAIGPAGLRALLDSGNLERVVHLDLSGNRITVDGVHALAAADLPRLRTLRLCHTGGVAETLLRLPALDQLELLDLSGNDVSDQDREFFDWAGPPVYRIDADPVAVALRTRLGDRLRL